MDGNVRALGPDVFRAVNSSNITIHLQQFKDILKVHQCVHKNVITLNKKQFNSNVCESRTMTQAQILVVLGHMRANTLVNAFKEFITDHFYDDIVQDEVMCDINDDNMQGESLQDKVMQDDIVMYDEKDVSMSANEITINPFEHFYIDHEKQLLITPYGNVSYKYYQHNELVFQANELAKALGYVNTSDAIRKHVQEKYCILYHDLNDVSSNSDLLGELKITPRESRGAN